MNGRDRAQTERYEKGLDGSMFSEPLVLRPAIRPDPDPEPPRIPFWYWLKWTVAVLAFVAVGTMLIKAVFECQVGPLLP
jgi:hypothetical protein